MKKLFALALVVFGLAACQTEPEGLDVNVGSEVDTTITVSLPETTRATDSALGAFDNVDLTGDATIRYILKIYQKVGEEYIASEDRQVEFNDEKSVVFPVRLVPNRDYRFVVWADYVEAEADVDKHYDTRDLTNIKLNGEWKAMDETRDAFTGVYCTVEEGKKYTGTSSINLTLTRPFAKLRVITTDMVELGYLGINPTHATVEYATPYRASFNALEGKAVAAVDSNVKSHDVFEIAAYNNDNTDANKVLFTDYFFAEDDVVKFTLSVYEDEAKTKPIKSNTFNTDINVKRNFLTTIKGNILTDGNNIEVNVDDEFDKPENTEQYVRSAAELQAAVDAAAENVTICFGADIVGDVTVIQKPDVKITINGKKQKYTGSIKVHSNSNHYADAALTIKNVNFETATASTNFIEALENGAERYSCNITVENCTFTATDAAVNTAVGVQIKASKNAQVIGCTATNMHSLIQAQSCDESVLVKNCTVTGKNGVAFKQVKAATVEGTTIVATGYGIRFDGNIDNYGITVKNNNVTASQPFIVRKMTGKDNTIALEGTNTLTVSAASISTEAPAYQIVITNGSDDEAYVKPTGTYTLTGADNYTIFPEPFPVASWNEFTAALAAGETDIKLTADITYDANYQLQKSVILNLGGYSMTLPMINILTKTTIKNGTINGKVYARKNSEIVFNNVTFSGAVADNLSTEGHLAIQGGCKSLYAKNCLFSPTSVSGSQTKPLSFEGGSTIMKFENCEFKSSPYKKQVYFNSLSATAKLDFTNCNFNNKTPNIMFAAACPLTNLTMSGTTKLGSVTLETNRAKDAVTAEDLAYLRESLIANNSMSSVRLFYAGGSSEYIR